MTFFRILPRGLAALTFALLAACGAAVNSPEVADAEAKANEAAGIAMVQGYYEAIEQAIAAGKPVTLPTVKHDSVLGADDFGEKQDLTLRLKPSDMIAKDAFFEINGTPAPWPFIRVYEGHVEGAEDQIAHVMVAEDFIRGAVRINDRMNLIRINMKGNRPVNMSRKNPDPEKYPTDKPPRSPEPSGCPSDPYGNLVELRAVPPYLDPGYTTAGRAAGMNTGPMLRSRLILDADYKAAQFWGTRHLAAMMIGMAVEADLTYMNQVNIHHQIVGVHQNRIANYYPNTFEVDPFAEMSAWWDAHHTERDIVHLFSGWDSEYAQANCIGSTGTLAGYAFSPIIWEEEYGWFHQNVLAHEWGHLYSAHHHYGNHVESDLATIMIQGYTAGAQPIFGTVERTVIRGWAEQYLKPW